MLIVQWCKTQIMCFLILSYIAVIYTRDGVSLNHVTKKSNCNPFFDGLLSISMFAIFFDGLTACTVNLTDRIPHILNLLSHFGMYLFYEGFVVLLFLYWVSVTAGIPKSKRIRAAILLPGVIFAVLTVVYMPSVVFLPGTYTDYSMGTAVYISFFCAAYYCLLTVILIVSQHRSIPKKKLISLETTVVFIVLIAILQIVFPESLITSFAVVMIIISIYLNMENPAIRELEHYHSEMVMGFATLVENKDDSTGGHIRRSSAYANLIAENLRRNKKYKTIITKDYLNNLIQSAPMHDIGKISISDAILQKPGKLTPEEFEKMKEHTTIGGRIIEDTFGHLLNNDYENMAYQVALYHHEKWNGKGYPVGLKETDIPLCARIMAVADVFDAVSSKRCYRDAMALDACYQIITNGRGVDFDPDVVDAFLAERTRIEKIYAKTNERTA